jgi:release factor glutamine methyltransferase
MINSKQLFSDFIVKISLEESPEELSAIGYMVLESVFGISKADILSNKMIEISPYFEMRLNEIAERINSEEPIQYILGKAWFYGREFKVHSAVLIPRPETEELVDYVIRKYRSSNNTDQLVMVDIGTGSGCIAISLSLELHSKIFATDVSEDALNLAKQNNHILEADVTFLKHDILNEEFPFSNVDLVVSNPPYIVPSEESEMKTNVVKFEPHLALFTPTDDPLIFYKKIALKSATSLKKNGVLITEINERFGTEVVNICSANGFLDVEIMKDMQGKDRFVVGRKN